MNKKLRGWLCGFLLLLLLSGFSGMTAFAENGDENPVTETELTDTQTSVALENEEHQQDDEGGLQLRYYLAAAAEDEEAIPFPGNTEDILSLAQPAEPEDLVKGFLLICPEGYYVSELKLVLGEEEKDLLPYMVPELNSPNLTLEKNTLADEDGNFLFAADEADENESSLLRIFFVPLEEKESYEICYDLSAGPDSQSCALNEEDGVVTQFISEEGKAFVIPSFRAPEVPGWSYSGMTVVFPNGTERTVSRGTRLALWSDVTIRLNYQLEILLKVPALDTITYGDALPETMYEVQLPENLQNPEEYSVTDVLVTCDAGTCGKQVVRLSGGTVQYAGVALNESSVKLSYSAGYLTVAPLEITLSAPVLCRNYDGTELTATVADITVSEGALADGDRIVEASLKGSLTTVGSTACKIEPKSLVIRNENGTDVTGNYKIQYTEGSLTINQTELSIRLEDQTAEYSGQRYYAELTVAGMAETDENRVSLLKELPGVCMVFESPLKLSISEEDLSITNADGVSVAENYCIRLEKAEAVITVTPRRLELGAPVKTVLYSGKQEQGSLDDIRILSGALAEGDYFRAAEFSGGCTIVGSAECSIREGSVVISNAAGEDVSSCYEIFAYEPGTITVEPDSSKNTVTITPDSLTKPYDGTALVIDPGQFTFTVTDAAGNPVTADLKVEIVLSNTSVGPLIPEKAVTVSIQTYRLTDSRGRDVSGEYNVLLGTGELSITPAGTAVPLTISISSITKKADGTAYSGHYSRSFTNNNSGMRFLVTADIRAYTQSGTATDAKSPGTYVLRPENIRITDANGEIVPEGTILYAVKSGTLTITEAPGTTAVTPSPNPVPTPTPTPAATVQQTPSPTPSPAVSAAPTSNPSVSATPEPEETSAPSESFTEDSNEVEENGTADPADSMESSAEESTMTAPDTGDIEDSNPFKRENSHAMLAAVIALSVLLAAGAVTGVILTRKHRKNK